MNNAPVFLNFLGMVNALGPDTAAIASRQEAGDVSGMTPDQGRMFGRVAIADGALAAPPARLAAWDCRNNRLALAALAPILPQIHVALERHGKQRVGLVFGTSTSGIAAGEKAVNHFGKHGALPAGYDYRPQEIGSGAGFLADCLGLAGPAYTISTACTSSAKVFAAARRLLRLGVCDAVVVGGADSLCDMTLGGFGVLELTRATLTNPMSRNRNGINIGEGAAFFLMTREPAR